MACGKKNTPRLPTEAYQLDETHHLGSPLNMYRAHFTDSQAKDIKSHLRKQGLSVPVHHFSPPTTPSESGIPDPYAGLP